jgi:DNA mismatch endonuclease (patch repair protein)
VVVFVDGCFWHGCTQHKTVPERNRHFWERKITRNRQRDRETDAVLVSAGWHVVRAWEHDDPIDVADRVEAAVRWRSREAPAPTPT